MADVIFVEDQHAVIVEEDRIEVVSVGTQGPPGPPGLPGPSGGASVQVLAAAAVGGLRAVVFTAAGAVHASNDNLAHVGLVSGISINAASSGGAVNVQSAGFVDELSWSWAPGDIWLGVDGALTQLYPAGALFSQRLGYAVSPTRVWIDLDQPIIH